MQTFRKIRLTNGDKSNKKLEEIFFQKFNGCDLEQSIMNKEIANAEGKSFLPQN